MDPSRQRPFRPARGGFTLIELLAVMLIIAILATFLIPKIPFVRNRAYITACRANLGEIGKGLLEYQTRFRRLPSEGGARFHCALIADGVWENTIKNAQTLTCPGVNTDSLPNLQGLPEEEWYADADSIDGDSTSYAGRNMKDFGFRRKVGSGKEVLVADDNFPEDNNHINTTLALMGDNSVREWDMVDLKKRRIIDEEMEFLEVGPGSPVEELQKLSLD